MSAEITTLCFSREEFFRDFVPEKEERQMRGKNKMIITIRRSFSDRGVYERV